jgi:lysyl-tRNA synthetase, class II
LAFDDNIYELRRQKLKQIEGLGQTAYRSRYEFTHTIPQILADYSDKTAEQLENPRVDVRVAGRIMAIRLMGKAGFSHLQQGGQRLQIYVKKDAIGDAGFELYKLLDIGDHIGVSGYLFRTRTGELTIHVEEITFLSKDLLPLPEKWHGLTDVELRYRQRYVDLVMNPGVREVFLKRSTLVQSLRRTMEAHGFVEVETPMMQPIAGGAVARPFVTHHNTLDMDLYLRIAPELYLKRLVVGGFDRVYEINRNFRNEGISTRHNPEFTMLEFYQAYTDCWGVMDLTERLIKQAALDVNGTSKVTVRDVEVTPLDYENVEIDFASFDRLSMREAIIKYWPDAAGTRPSLDDFAHWEKSQDLVRRAGQALRTASLPKALTALFKPTPPLPGLNTLWLFENVVEEHLIQPTVIYEFPSEASPLAKRRKDEPEWAERFEIYAAGMEISNGFSELNDPEEQRKIFESQLRDREVFGGTETPAEMDEDYIRALSYGMPPAGGCGVGVDRLCMLLTDSPTIRDVILFPLLRPEKESSTEGNPEEKL